MNNNLQTRNEKENALKQLSVARGNLLLMIVLTVVNILLSLLGSDTMLLFSATVPYFAATVGILSEIGILVGIGVGIAAVILGIYLLCWIFSKKHYGWMIAALVLFALDTLAMIGIYMLYGDVSGVLDVLIHAWVLYYLVIGVRYGYKLKKMPPETEVSYEMPQENQDATEPIPNNSIALRMADMDVKNRVLIEGDFIGHHICYRRVKRVNELVIDGYVYADVEMLVENVHVLEAIVDGHRICVGFNGTHSYISVDGQQVAKKIRLV